MSVQPPPRAFLPTSSAHRTAESGRDETRILHTLRLHSEPTTLDPAIKRSIHSVRRHDPLATQPRVPKRTQDAASSVDSEPARATTSSPPPRQSVESRSPPPSTATPASARKSFPSQPVTRRVEHTSRDSPFVLASPRISPGWASHRSGQKAKHQIDNEELQAGSGKIPTWPAPQTE